MADVGVKWVVVSGCVGRKWVRIGHGESGENGRGGGD